MRKKITSVLVALVGLLIVFVLFFPAIGSHSGASVPRARVEVASIAMAAKTYWIKYGSFPTGTLAEIAATLSGQNSNGIVFIERQKRSIRPDGEFIDPWGRPYAITFPSATTVVVRSAGRDKVFETADDIARN